MIIALLSTKAAAVALAVTAATGTAAAAAGGVLPGTGDDQARPVVSQNQKSDGADHAEDAESGAPEKDAGRVASDHGAAVSELATTTDLTGRDKGISISTLASAGRSNSADEHGQSPDHAAEPDNVGRSVGSGHSLGSSHSLATPGR